jgi:ABC-2 type transport system ATP-binding protein
LIEVKNISKTFTSKKRKIHALKNLNLKIKKGEIFGIIGPTGAGKTTLIKILSTLILPDEGEAYINGFDILKEDEKVREIIGVVAGEFTRALYWRLSGRENIEFFAKIKGLNNYKREIDYLLEIFDLKGRENEPVMKYSTGMKHKLALAIALLNNPPILFLDEPLTGIDPVTAYEIKKLIKEEFRDKTVVWTSHNLYEIEEMCKNILLLNEGVSLLVGNVAILKNKYWDYEKVIVECDKPEKLLGIENSYIIENKVEIKTINLSETLREVSEVIKNENIKVFNISTSKPSLEDIFMRVIKNERT